MSGIFFYFRRVAAEGEDAFLQIDYDDCGAARLKSKCAHDFSRFAPSRRQRFYFAPGTAWRYSMAIDVLGAVVAAATVGFDGDIHIPNGMIFTSGM